MHPAAGPRLVEARREFRSRDSVLSELDGLLHPAICHEPDADHPGCCHFRLKNLTSRDQIPWLGSSSVC